MDCVNVNIALFCAFACDQIKAWGMIAPSNYIINTKDANKNYDTP